MTTPPETPGLTPLFRTASGALYAQDGEGRIFRDGELTFSGPLLAVAVPRSPEGNLAVGYRAFLLIDDGVRLGWRISTPIAELYAEPVVAPMPEGWRWDPGELLDLVR